MGKLTEEEREILRTDLNARPVDLAARFGISVRQVNNYRKEGREQRHEAAKSLIAQHVEENIPDALADLTVLRRLAREKYEATGNPRQGQLWLGAIKTTLEHVTPDDADLDREIERELARLVSEGQSAPAGPIAVPIRNGK